jgi:hypothetical protein
MLKKIARVSFLLGCALQAAYASAVLLSGNSMNLSDATLTANLAQLTGNTYTFVAPSDFATTALAGFDLVWLDGFSQYASLDSLGPYLNAGGYVLVQNPGFGSNPLSDFPDASGFSAVFQFGDTVHILLPGNPLNAGLTDGGLSGWGSSSYGYFSAVPGGYATLSDDGNPADAITVSTQVGSGELIYTEQGLSQYLNSQSFSANSPALTFLENAAAAPEPGSAGLLFFAMTLPAVWIARRCFPRAKSR